MGITNPAAAGQPAPSRTDRIDYCTRDGRLMSAHPRSCWDWRLYLVLDVSDPSCARDTLCTVDDFGDLAVTHRRDPRSFCGMNMVRAAA